MCQQRPGRKLDFYSHPAAARQQAPSPDSWREEVSSNQGLNKIQGLMTKYQKQPVFSWNALVIPRTERSTSNEKRQYMPRCLILCVPLTGLYLGKHHSGYFCKCVFGWDEQLYWYIVVGHGVVGLVQLARGLTRTKRPVLSWGREILADSSQTSSAPLAQLGRIICVNRTSILLVRFSGESWLTQITNTEMTEV